jgi:hypothetical protein
MLCAVDIIFSEADKTSIEKIYNAYNQQKNFVYPEEEPEPEPEPESDTELEPDFGPEPDFSDSGSVSEFGGKFKLQTLLKEFETPRQKPVPQYELEFKIYPHKGKKETLQKFTYYYFLDFLKKSGMRHIYTPSIDILLNYKDTTYRSTYLDTSLAKPITNQVKQKIAEYFPIQKKNKVSEIPMIFKLTYSSETESGLQINVKNRIKNQVIYNLIRVKSRDSFFLPDNLWRIDITRVISTIKGSQEVETYEIECEYIGGNIPFQIFLESMNNVYKLVLYNTSYC